MSGNQTGPRLEVFPQRQLTKQFEDELNRLTQMQLDVQRAKYLPPENTQHYSHGTGWLTTDGHASTKTSEFSEHRHEVQIKVADLFAHDLTILPKHIHDMTQGMMRQFAEMFYSTLSDAAESAGNVVQGANHSSPAYQFLRMIQTVQFGIGKDGKPSLPEVRGGTEAINKLFESVQAQDAEFQQLLESTIEQKKSEAAEREKVRRARFRGLAQ